jgi:hypothetical protein
MFNSGRLNTQGSSYHSLPEEEAQITTAVDTAVASGSGQSDNKTTRRRQQSASEIALREKYLNQINSALGSEDEDERTYVPPKATLIKSTVFQLKR